MLTAFSANSIKGRVAETIIQELFLAHGFNVFHYGMERSVPGIAQLTRRTEGEVKRRIQSMPDFVVQDPRNNRLHFVEVKYRASGQFSIDDIKGEYPWPHAYFIIVSKESAVRRTSPTSSWPTARSSAPPVRTCSSCARTWTWTVR